MGGSSVGTQLRCSLWRHALGHLRQWPWVVGALVVALTPFALLAGLKSTAPPEHLQACHFEARGLSTEWPLGVLQSFVCGMANQCQKEGQDDLLDHYPGAAVNNLINASQLIDDGSGSALDRLFALPWSLNLLKGVTDLISAPALTGLMENGLQVSDIIRSPSELALKLTSEHGLDAEVVEAFLDARINVSRVFSLAGQQGTREVVCSPEDLREFLVTANTTLVTEISWSLCHLPLAQAANVTSVFLSSLDPGKVLHMVGEVLEAVGGYNREFLLQQVGGLLSAVGRLEALAPLDNYLAPVLSALSPTRNARKILSLSMWNETSLADFLGFVENVVRTLTADPSVLRTDMTKSAINAALHLLSFVTIPSSVTDQLQGLSDPWEAVLRDIGVAAEKMVAELEAGPHHLRQRPVLRSLVSLATISLSTLLNVHPYNATRMQEEVDEALVHVLEASEVPMNSSLALTLLPALKSAEAFTAAADAVSSLVVVDEEQPLPLQLSLRLLVLFSNCSQLKNAVEGVGLDGWLCDKESWGQLSEADWDVLSMKLCSEKGMAQLHRTSQLLQDALNYSQITDKNSVTASKMVKAVRKLLITLQNSTHLHQALQMAHNGLSPSLNPEWARHWKPEEENSEPSSPLLPPHGDAGFQDLKKGVQVSKFIIRRLVTVYLNLLGGECGGASGGFAPFLPPGAFENAAEVTTSVLDTIVNLMAVTQQPRYPGDFLHHPSVPTFLTNTLLPNVMMVVAQALEVAQSPWVEVPAPLPQLLELLNATHSALTSVLEEENVWAWCGNGSCPHLANLASRTHLLPHLLALPYFMSVVGPEEDVQQLLANSTAWRHYPCQYSSVSASTSASLSMFFPPPSTLTPDSQRTIKKVKEEVKELEEYICVNFKVVLDELTSNEALTNAVKAFMDKLTPERINLGATVGLVRSLWETMNLLDPYEIVTNLTGGVLLAEDWERPYSYIVFNGSVSDRVVMQVVERVLENLPGGEEGNETRLLYRTFNLGLHAAHNITAALTDLLQEGDITLANILGVSEEDPLFSRFIQGPDGLADFLLHQLNASLISAVMERDLERWASGLCKHNRSSSPWVEVVCNYTHSQVPPSLLPSNLSTAVVEAVAQFQQQKTPQPPLFPPSQLLSDLQDLSEALRTFNFSAPPDITVLDLMVNVTKREVDRFLAGLREMQEEWPWLVLDALVRRGPMEVKMILKETHFVLTSLLSSLPSPSSPSENNTVPSIIEVLHLVNTSWVDLLAGVHYNIHHHQHALLGNLTVEKVCGPNSTLEEPMDGDGGFLEAVSKLCQFVAANSDIFEEHMYSQNDSVPLPSVKQVYNKALELVSRLGALWAAGRNGELQGVSGWPSYFMKENWGDLIARISPNITNSHDIETWDDLIASLVEALDRLGVPQNSTFPKSIILQMKWMKLLMAEDLKEALHNTSELSGLADTITQTAPLALRDLVEALTKQPDVVGKVLVVAQGARGWESVCQLNVSALGNHFAALLRELCPLTKEALVADLRSLLGLDLLHQPDPIMSLEETLRSTLAYVSTLDKMDNASRSLSAPEDLVQYMGLQQWMDLPSDAFNVTLEEMEENSTMILGAVLGPLVALGEQQSGEGNVTIKAVLRDINAYLRLAHWLLIISYGNVREAYMDKPMVIHLLDIIDQLPEITQEYITLFTHYSTLSEAVKLKTELPCPFHLSLLENLTEVEEEGGESKGIHLLNSTIHFLCDQRTSTLMWEQLMPRTLPVIMNEEVDVDAATLAHLVTDVGRAMRDVLEGRHTRETVAPPPWLARDRWEGIYLHLRSLVKRPVKEVVLEGVFLGVSAAQVHSRDPQVRSVLPLVVNVVYQLSSRLADGINESTGRLDLVAAAEGLGSLQELIALVAARFPTHVAMAMWFPESLGYWKLLRGDSIVGLHEEVCQQGPQHLFLHPGLPQQDWEAVQHVLCNFSLPQLRTDVSPLLNTTEIMDGRVVDLAKVKRAVERLLTRLPSLDLRQFAEPFVNNVYTAMRTRLTPAQRVMHGLLGPLTLMYQGALDGETLYYFNATAPSLVQITVALQPISREGAPSLLERLVDPDLFVALLQEYDGIWWHMQEAVMALEADNMTSYSQVLSELHMTLLNLTEALVPKMPPSGTGMSLGDTLLTILQNMFQNGARVVHTATAPVCYCHSNDSSLGEGWSRVGQWMEMGERQVGRMEEYVDLLCHASASASNLTHFLRSLWEDLGWKEAVLQLVAGGNSSISCLTLMDQVKATYERFLAVVRHYTEDEASRTRLSDCLLTALHSHAGQQFIGAMVATGHFLRAVSNDGDFTAKFSSSLESIPKVARVLRMLGSRVAVMVPLGEVLVRNYGQNLNLSWEEMEATRHLLVDVNRIFPGDEDDMEKLAALSETLEGMQKWLRVMEGNSTWDPDEEKTPLEVLFEVAKNRGADVFAADLLKNVNYAYLLTEGENMRVKAVISLGWLNSLVSHLTLGIESLAELSRSGGIVDLNKLVTGEEDPVSFLSGSVKFVLMEQWKDLAQSFEGLLEEGIPILTGSQLGEDLERVVRGVNSLVAVRDMGLLDFNVPITSLIANFSGLEDYLLRDLHIEPRVVEALATSKLNLLALVSLEGTSVEEVLCEGEQMGRLVVLPAGTQVTPAQVSAALCSSNDSEALAASFLYHLNLTPLMTMLTRFGVNASLSSHGVSLGEVAKAVKNVVQTSEHLPTILTTLRAFHNLSEILLKPPKSERFMANKTSATIADITAPEFLERAGQALCGRPIELMPDTLRIQEAKNMKMKRSSSSNEELSVCDQLHEDLRSLPGGGLLLHYIQPLLAGKIFFTPDNSITRAIIAQANETFVAVDRQQQYLTRLSEGIRGMTSSPSTQFDLERLEEALELPWVQRTMEGLLHSIPLPGSSSFNFSSMPSLSSLTDNLKEASPQLLESSQLVREFSDVLEVGLSLMSCLQLQRFVPVKNESQLMEEAQRAVQRREFLAGVVFKDVGESGSTETVLPQHLTYTIRVDYSKSPPTFLLGPRFWRPGPYADMAFYMRYQQGFIQLQESLEHAILKLQHRQAKTWKGSTALHRGKRSAGAPLPLTAEEEDLLLNLPVHTKQEPYPCYSKDDFLQMVNESPVMSFIFSFLSLVLFSTFLIQQLVQERESRNKQLQEVMGLRLWLDHLVWLLYSLLLLLVIVLLSALLLSFGGLQPRADFGVLMAFLFCYGLSVVSFCYLVACLVPTTVLAVFTGVMGLLVFNVPFISISVIQTSVPITAVLLTCILPSTAFGFGFRVICQYELVEQGASYSNMWTTPTKGSEMTLGLAMVMLLVDTVLFFVLALITNYFRNACRASVFAGTYPDSKVAPAKEEMNSTKKDAIHVVDLDLGLKQSLRKGLSIKGLRKIYHHGGNNSRVAVDGVTLDLYEGQVLALLGHNGAGKTTIISMLTHEVEPTAGKILVYGEDISRSEGWEKARHMIGLCPQESVLFPLLTVEETLTYYTALKQHPSDPPPTKVTTVLANMDLLGHRSFLAHQLSEGLRRRLCMALAFVGHSKLVVLDEPTSGIDPAARSAMWEVISNNRTGRTILLTTHHLDEAETLADRVAVLNKGRLLCVGSPLALKSEYGLGYSITLSKTPPPPPPPPPPKSKTDSLHAFTEKTALSYSELPFKVLKTSSGVIGRGVNEKVLELLTQYVPNARLLESINGEVTYSLPIHDTFGNTNRLPELFGELEGRLESLGFYSLELRPTSLEDVIIALNTINAIESSSNTKNLKVDLPPEPQKEDFAGSYDFSLEQAKWWVGLRRLIALLHKRLLHHSRDWHFYVQMFVLPFLFILLAMVSSKWRPSFSTAAPLTFDPSLYTSPTTTFLRTLDPILGPLADEVTQLSLGDNSRTGNWSSCPEFVADTNPGLKQCSVSGSSVRSSCQCEGQRCVVEATEQPSLNDWMLATRTHHVQNRPGGITLGVKDPREGRASRSGALVWYDNSAYHALPSFINLLNNARLRRLAGPGHSITAINHPIVFTMHGMWSMSIQQYVADLGIGLLVLVALTVVCSSTVGCMVAERVRGERRLLHLAGLSKTTYWIGSALWDAGVLLLNVLLIAVVFLAFNEQQFIWRENLWAFVLLALLYGLSILPLFYLSEGWFRTEASAVFSFFCTSFGVGLITTLLLVVCQVMSYIKGMHDTEAVIKYLFLVFPPFAFTCGLKDMAAGYTKMSIMAHFDMDLYQSPFSWDPELQGGLGVYMVALGMWALVGWALLLCPRHTPNPAPLPLAGEAEEDKDVAAERIKIQCGGTSLYNTVLRLVGLGRDFSSPHVTAVGNLFLALRRGECFSLLGLNGAGKTTAFRCLTGDLSPSRGQILVNGLLLEEALELPHPILSYCPQSHALDPNLTSREVLTNMAKMRGATGHRTKEVVEQAIRQLGLTAEANTFVRHMSGGNKRKLSVAVSLLGNPLLVLMDEPTTGMDPSSRRLVWHAIQSVTQDGRSVLLTSHSMDEVNQLSHRLAIMVNGHFACLGSPHYLKHRLGDKYTVRLKTNDIEDMTYVMDYLRSQLKEVLLKEHHHLSLVVEVSRQLPLRLIFDTLNGAKSLGVTEYDVSQTTLNEVFRVLTSYQSDGQAPASCKRATLEQDGLPSHLPHLHPAGDKAQLLDPVFQHPSVVAPVECINLKGRYSDFGGVLEGQGKGGLLASESGSANDSPEEEWTHF